MSRNFLPLTCCKPFPYGVMNVANCNKNAVTNKWNNFTLILYGNLYKAWNSRDCCKKKKTSVIFKLILGCSQLKVEDKNYNFYAVSSKFSGSQEPLPEVEGIFIFIPYICVFQCYRNWGETTPGYVFLVILFRRFRRSVVFTAKSTYLEERQMHWQHSVCDSTQLRILDTQEILRQRKMKGR